MKLKIVKSTPIEDLVKDTTDRWRSCVNKLIEVNSTIQTLSDGRNRLLFEIDDVVKLFHKIRLERPDIKLPNLALPLNIRFVANPNLTIGDAMEMLLIERGPLTQREIIDELNKGGLRINPKNPHIIIANAIKRDTRKRFKRVKNGRVALAEPKGKADEPR